MNKGHWTLTNEHDAIETLLADKGYWVEDITDVVLSHLHCYHCNGAVLNENGLLKL